MSFSLFYTLFLTFNSEWQECCMAKGLCETFNFIHDSVHPRNTAKITL